MLTIENKLRNKLRQCQKLNKILLILIIVLLCSIGILSVRKPIEVTVVTEPIPEEVPVLIGEPMFTVFENSELPPLPKNL